MSVILHTPAVVRFTAPVSPERHLQAAQALGADTKGAGSQDAGEVLAGRIIHFMRRLGMPNGLSAVGYNEADIPTLVAGTLPQHRVTKLSPRPAGPDDLATLFRDSMRIW
jgi:hydroxyacid-oxoacid transhydrogenase